ncbi:MAG TPA: hypothetical protein V6D19_23080, partial [Stenomitos sp.]
VLQAIELAPIVERAAKAKLGKLIERLVPQSLKSQYPSSCSEQWAIAPPFKSLLGKGSGSKQG